MEILIVGVIIVALMAYVSTKIKKAAQQAYEPEALENEYFTITKPEGLIIPVKDKSEFMFEAYSKEFGEDDSEKFNQCWAVVNEKDGTNYDVNILESEKIEQDVTIKTYNKTLVSEKLNKSFELEISVIPEYQEKYADGIKLLLQSFNLK